MNPDDLVTQAVRVWAVMLLIHGSLVTPYDNIDMGEHWLVMACWHQAITLTNVDISSMEFSSTELGWI